MPSELPQPISRGTTEPLPCEPARESFLIRIRPFLILAIATLVYHAQILATSGDTVLDGYDIPTYVAWLHQFSRESLLAGRLPLWNPHIYAGVPFLANPQTTVFYPPSWLYLAMPVAQAEKWMVALHIFAAGSFMFLFLRRVGLRQSSALLASLPWMFSSYFAARSWVGHLTLMFTATWIPLALYCVERLITDRRWRWAVLTGLVMGVQLTAGGDQNCYYTGLAMAVYGAARLVGLGLGQPRRFGWKDSLRLLGQVALAAVVAGGASAAQLLPTAEMAQHSDRAAVSFAFVSESSFPFTSAAVFALPWSDGLHRIEFRTLGLNFNLNWELAGYIGLLPLAAAMVSFCLRKRPALAAVRAVLVLAAILMLGEFTPIYHWLFNHLPGIGFFRIPGRAVVLFVWAMCAMSGFGFDWLFDPTRTNWRTGRWRPAAIVALTALLVAAVLSIAFAHPMRPAIAAFCEANIPVRFTDWPIARAIVVMLVTLAGLIALGKLNRRAAWVVVIAVIGLDLALARPVFPVRPWDPAREPAAQRMKDLQADLTRRVAGPFRLDVCRTFAAPDAAMVDRVENVNGYWPLAVGRFYRYVHAMRNVPIDAKRHSQLSDDIYSTNITQVPILNVAATVTCATQPDNYADYRLMSLESYLPRAWLADRVEQVAGESEAMARMKQPGFDPANTVLLEAAPRITLPAAAPASQPGDCVTVTQREGGGLNIRTQTAAERYLVISEVFYPGWQATMDGKPVAIERADSVIAALPLPAGSHEVEFFFDPLSVKLGLALTGATWLAAGTMAGALAVAAVRNRRRRKTSPTT
jgi:hypothetical protein